MDFKDKRQKLDGLRAKTRKLAAGICERLEKAKQKAKGKDKTLITELLEKFKNQDELAFLFIPESGDKYYDARIKRERKLNAFLSEALDMLIKAEALSDKEQAEKLKILKENVTKWENGEEVITMQDSVLKQQLIDLLEQTERDVKVYCDVLGGLPTNNEGEERRKSESLQKAAEVQAKLLEAREIIENTSVEDSEEAKAAAQEVVNCLIEVRDVLPAGGNSRRLKQKLNNLDEALAKWKKIKANGKKLKDRGNNLGTIDRLTAENLEDKVENADELTSAVFVLEIVGFNEEFLNEQEERALEEIRRRGEAAGLENDRYYQELVRQRDNAVARLRTMSPKDPMYATFAREALAKKNACVEYANKAAARRRRTSTSEEKLEKELHETCQEIRDVSIMYSYASRMPYKERAKIMAEHGVYDFSELFDRYVTALYNNDMETIDDIITTLKALKEAYEPYIEEEEEEPAYEDPITIVQPEVEELTEEEKAALRELGLLPDEPTTGTTVTEDPITESPVVVGDGDVETVNTTDVDRNRKRAKDLMDEIE